MTNRRILQIFLIAFILTSSSMLAVSINHYYLIPIALVATLGAFTVTDVLKWISIEGWVANIASIGFLVYSMFEFYPADSAGKLVAVAKLLVYLQAVLVFQTKTPRLNWQIMVLSLLQVVIATIFSIHLDGGLLFMLSFIIGGITLVLQNRFACEHAIEKRNVASDKSQEQIDAEESSSRRLAFWRYASKPIPTVTYLDGLRSFSLRPLAVLPGVALVASMFTSVVFLTAPRHVDPWFSPISIKVSSTSLSKSVNLEETGVIRNSKDDIFEAKFEPMNSSSSSDPIQLTELPYFRGIALSNLTFKDGKTNWNAAYERVNSQTYQSLPRQYMKRNARSVKLNITLEKTAEPLLYSVMPTSASLEKSQNKLKFCHEISAYTRCRENEEIDFAPFSYEFLVTLSDRNSPAKAWPYIANTDRLSYAPMEKDPAQHRWLTRMDRKNYPTLVKTADRIAGQVRDSGGGRIELVRAIENHFLNPANYSYTLDYTDVKRNTTIDPNEDFVANFKEGHCTAFASAMTLLLRSQGIPARLVVGFHGGDFNQIDQSYMVKAIHAHTWVEVYLRHQDCQDGGIEEWQYSQGGAWLTADPTPAQPVIDDGIGTEDAIELARNAWQDYVLGMDSDRERNEDSSLTARLVDMLAGFDIDNVSNQLAESRRSGWLAAIQPLFVVGLILALLIGTLRMLILNAGYEEEQPDTAVGKIRRFLADAIGLISSDLREWVIGYNSETAFYKKMTEVLEQHDLVREPAQTHLEFASEVENRFAEHPSSELISTSMQEITKAFNRIRFGLEELDSAEREAIDQQLAELEVALKA